MDVIKTPYELRLEMIKSVAERHQLPVPVVLGDRRDRFAVAARREVCQHLRASGLSSPQIGRIINRDHTSVLNLLGTTAVSKKRRKAKPMKHDPNCAITRHGDIRSWCDCGVDAPFHEDANPQAATLPDKGDDEERDSPQ